MSALNNQLNICGAILITAKQLKRRERILQDGDTEEGCLDNMEHLLRF